MSGDRPPTASAESTPITISPRTRTVLVVIAIVLLVLLVRVAPSVLTMLLGGATLALFLSFPVRVLSRVVPRTLAILLVLLFLVLLLVLLVVVVVPLLIDQLSQLISASPRLAGEAEQLVRDLLQPLQTRGLLPAEPNDLIAAWKRALIDRGQDLAKFLVSWLLGAVSGAVGTVIELFGMVFVAVYLLADIHDLKSVYLRLAPKRYRPDALELWDAVAYSLSRYLVGLLISITVQGALAALLLTLIGVPYALLLGIWMSVSALLPYIGAWLGAIPAVLIALFISPLTAVLTALTYVAINMIEGNLLTPRVQGEAVNVPPILVFLAVIAGGQVAGIAGSIYAVPTLGILRVLYDFFGARLRVEPPAPSRPPYRRLSSVRTRVYRPRSGSGEERSE